MIPGAWYADDLGGYTISNAATTAKLDNENQLEPMGVYAIAFLSAYDALWDTLKKDQRVFITAGSSGVGHFALQIAKLRTDQIITNASRPESIKLCQELVKGGEKSVFNYKTDDTVKTVRDFFGGKGADFVFDCTYSEKSWRQTIETVESGGTWSALWVRSMHRYDEPHSALLLRANFAMTDPAHSTRTRGRPCPRTPSTG